MPSPAFAACSPMGMKDAIAALDKSHGEKLTAGGVFQDGQQLMSITVNKKTGTWTILVRTNVGLTCIAGTGTAWRDLKIKRGTAL